MYKVCEGCKGFRESGQLSNAIVCRRCDGKGIVVAPESYVCNMCGGGMVGEIGNILGLAGASVSGGPDSDGLSDMMSYRFSICEKCLRSMFEKFKVPVQPKGYGGFPDEDWKTHLEYLRRRDWQWDKGREKKYPTGLCTYDKKCRNKGEWLYLCSDRPNADHFCKKHKDGNGRCGNCMWLSTKGIRIKGTQPGKGMPYEVFSPLKQRFATEILRHLRSDRVSLFRWAPCMMTMGTDAFDDRSLGGSTKWKMLFFPELKTILEEETVSVQSGRFAPFRWHIRGIGNFVICAPYEQEGERDDEKEDKKYLEWVSAMQDAMGEDLIETRTTRFEDD